MTAPLSVLDSRYSWGRLALTLLIATIGNVGMWAFIAVLPSVQAEFAVERGAASLPYALTMTGFALGNFFLGRVADRLGITLTLVCCALVLGLGFAGAAAAPSIWVLTPLHFFIGLGAAATFGPLMADISHWFLRRRGVAMTVAASGNYLAGAFWPWLLSDMLATDGWRAVYITLGIVVVAAVIPLSLPLRRRPPEEAIAMAGDKAQAASVTAGLSPRALTTMLFIAGIGCCMAMSMPQVHIVAYCVDLGYGPAVGVEMLSLMLLGGVVSRILSGFLADWIGGLRTLLLGSALQCLALFLYLPFDGLISLYLVSLVFGLSQGGIVPSYAIVVREYLPPKEAGARVGLVIGATIFGMALGGWTSGWIYDLTGSYQAAFLNGIAWNFLNIGIILTILFRSRPRALAMAPA